MYLIYDDFSVCVLICFVTLKCSNERNGSTNGYGGTYKFYQHAEQVRQETFRSEEMECSGSMGLGHCSGQLCHL